MLWKEHFGKMDVWKRCHCYVILLPKMMYFPYEGFHICTLKKTQKENVLPICFKIPQRESFSGIVKPFVKTAEVQYF